MPQNPYRLHQRPRPRRARFRRRDGYRNLSAPRFHESLVRRTVPFGPQTDRDHPPRLLDAGADVLTTNTFGAQRPALEKYGLADKVSDINRAGTAIARRVADAADRPVLVAGRSARWPRNGGRRGVFDAEAIAEQAAALWEGGADFIIFETQPSRAALEQFAAAMNRCPKCPSSFPVCSPGRANRSPANRSNTCWPRCPRRAAAARLGPELRHRA